jgi:hypothetical protein
MGRTVLICTVSCEQLEAVMHPKTESLDQVDEEILGLTVTDEALEAAAGAERVAHSEVHSVTSIECAGDRCCDDT